MKSRPYSEADRTILSFNLDAHEYRHLPIWQGSRLFNIWQAQSLHPPQSCTNIPCSQLTSYRRHTSLLGRISLLGDAPRKGEAKTSQRGWLAGLISTLFSLLYRFVSLRLCKKLITMANHSFIATICVHRKLGLETFERPIQLHKTIWLLMEERQMGDSDLLIQNLSLNDPNWAISFEYEEEHESNLFSEEVSSCGQGCQSLKISAPGLRQPLVDCP